MLFRSAMTEQLNVRRKALLEEIESGKRKMEALAQSKNLFESIAGQVPLWIIAMDKTGVQRYVNHSASEVLLDISFEDRLHGWLMRQAEESKTVPRTEDLELYGNGKEQFFRVELHELQWDEDDTLVFIMTDVSSSRARLKKLEGMAYYDPLTKAYNRHYGMELLSEWLEKRNVFICCFVDMDNLKYVNDKFGHGEGDRYILSVAEALGRFADDAIVCRLGGDEFMMLATDWTNDTACRHLETLRNELTAIDHGTYRHSISYGVVEVDADNTLSASEVLRVADERMYAYKRKHKIPPTK